MSLLKSRARQKSHPLFSPEDSFWKELDSPKAIFLKFFRCLNLNLLIFLGLLLKKWVRLNILVILKVRMYDNDLAVSCNA